MAFFETFASILLMSVEETPSVRLENLKYVWCLNQDKEHHHACLLKHTIWMSIASGVIVGISRWKSPISIEVLMDTSAINHNWLVVSTPLKNISQLGWLFPIYGKIKNGSKPPTSCIKTPGETHRFSTILLSGKTPTWSRAVPVRSGCEISASSPRRVSQRWNLMRSLRKPPVATPESWVINKHSITHQ